MAAHPNDRDPAELIALVEHAHALIDKLIDLPSSQRERSWELILELQSVVDEFKRRRPAPLFRTAQAPELVRPRSDGERCEICLREVESGEIYMRFRESVFHEDCLPICWHCEQSVRVQNCARISRVGFTDKWRAVHIVCPERWRPR